MAVLPYGRSGMISALVLGFGRAIGETIAVALVLSATYGISFRILDPGGNTIAANIANRWGDANDDQPGRADRFRSGAVRDHADRQLRRAVHRPARRQEGRRHDRPAWTRHSARRACPGASCRVVAHRHGVAAIWSPPRCSPSAPIYGRVASCSSPAALYMVAQTIVVGVGRGLAARQEPADDQPADRRGGARSAAAGRRPRLHHRQGPRPLRRRLLHPLHAGGR